MNNLSEIKQTMSSREIAQVTGKRHDHVLRDIDNLNTNYEKLCLPKVGVSSYEDTTGRTLRCYELTKMDRYMHTAIELGISESYVIKLLNE